MEPGHIFTLLGPNGAGKTTIIRIISGLILPQKGEVNIDGYDMRKNEYRARQAIGLVLGEERTFYYRLSGRQNLEFFGGLYGIDRPELKKRIKRVLDLVGLTDNANLQYMRFSTGMKKRLSMARALLHNPKVLLLDEPNSGVDPESAQKLRDIIYSLKKEGRTILLTTHNMDEAEKMSDVLAFLKEGRIIKIGPLDEFKSLIKRRHFTVEFDNYDSVPASNIEMLKKNLLHLPSCRNVEFVDRKLVIDFNGSMDINTILSPLVQHGIKIKNVMSSEPSLEEVFIKLVR